MAEPYPPDTTTQQRAPAATQFTEDLDGRGTSSYEPTTSASIMDGPKRSGTLKKRSSVKRPGSRSRSRSRPGSIRSVQMDADAAVNKRSVFYTPVPTKGAPTEILVNRFNAWRRVLKDFITYFKEVQSHYETRSRGIAKLTNTLNVAAQPSEFLGSGGILETNTILRDFHKEATVTTESAAKIESEIVRVLIQLRSDLGVKIKEIKGLSGDFKNSVDKQKEVVRREVAKLQDALGAMETGGSNGKDPYLVRLEAEKRIRQYLTEENYLHKAYLNLEHSGRELEKIIVTQIQKVYSTYVNIITHEGQELLDLADRLTASTLRVSPDYEWSAFVERDPEMVSPSEKLRTFSNIEYPGYNHPGALEIMAGPMERKSKYLKSFTGGWYVLTPTHLHEFKYAERLHDQTPVLSLPLADSSLGKYSDPSALSHKFVMRSRKSGSLHRGHSWVFRAETHEKMMEWFTAIQKLTESSATERNDFIVRSASQRLPGAARPTRPRSDSYSSEIGLENDEADEIPYSAQHSTVGVPEDHLEAPERPEGGRFPSDLNVHEAGDNYSERSISPEPESHTARNAAAGAAAAGTIYAGYNYANRQDDKPLEKPLNYDNERTTYNQPQEVASYRQTTYGSPVMEQGLDNRDSHHGTYGNATHSDVSAPDGGNNFNVVPIVAPGYNNNAQTGGVLGTQPGTLNDQDYTKNTTASGAVPLEQQRVNPQPYHVQTSTGYQTEQPTTTYAQGTSAPGYTSQVPQDQYRLSTSTTDYIPVGISHSTLANSAPAGNYAMGAPGVAQSDVPRTMPAVNAEEEGRPSSPILNPESADSISHLHVPGEYPKGHGLQQDMKNVV